MNLTRILVAGTGGREHALAWKLAQSPRVARVLVAPGNGGTALAGGKIGNVPIAADDIAMLVRLAKDENIELVVVGPEAPLAAGAVDAFRASGIRCFGPSQAAAQLESSKAFAKAFMQRHGIPTARYAVFTDFNAAIDHVHTIDYPIVVKASGLAAGKGVLLPESLSETEAVLHQIMVEQAFGAAGDEVVIEVAKARRGWELRRVVQVPPTATAVDRRVDEDLPAAMEPAAPALQIGDLVLARVRFTKSDGTGRASKLRPCVVMEIGSLEVVVRPVYGSGSSMAKTGGCRRLLHWRDAGLHKPSCVGAEDIYLPVSPAPRRTGTLHPEDVQRLIDENR